MYHTNINNCIKALLIFGSAMIFVCCGDTENLSKKTTQSKERLLTESSDNFTMIMSENGRSSYIFTAPSVEGYMLASEPYREFNRGVEIITFTNDSLNMQDSKLIANYAIYYENRKLWEAVGDVVVTKTDGKELYSQQLFWNAQTKRIYSNVDTKIMDRSTGDVYLGEGFESDEAMEDWSFRKMTGRMKMNVEPRQPVDSLATEDKLIVE
ncbi:MAG: LPS export ABC transporter periplasmic protein LptC [Rikenellaceae bacterium]